jgi:cytochrome c553
MTVLRLPLLKNRWMTISVSAVIVVVTIAAAIGFVWIPTSQSGSRTTSFWDAICSAAGVPVRFRPIQLAPTAANRPSDVVTTYARSDTPDDKSISRGAKAAMQCTACHIAHGTNITAFPNLAGQTNSVIYKQLADFKAGHRSSSVMETIAKALDAQTMRDLAAYYADLPRTYPIRWVDDAAQPPALVRNGAPMRGIAACASCHGASKNSVFTPRLEGQPVDYLSAQLANFSRAERHNDINAQMRNVTRHLTTSEIREVSTYYASR